MADSELGSLRDRLRRSLEAEVTPLTQVDNPAAADFVRLIGAVRAMRRVARDLEEIDGRLARLESLDPTVAEVQRATLGEHRRGLVEALNTLAREVSA